MKNVSDSSSDAPKKPKKPKKLTFLFWSTLVFIVILFILLGLSIAIMKYCYVEKIFMVLTGTPSKLELLKFIGWIISGLIAIFGVFGLVQRATALDKQNKINEDAHAQQAEALNKQHKMTEKGHIHERFKTATDHLGSEKLLVRIASFNEFYHIVEIEPTMQNTIFNILFAHLEQIIRHENYQQKEKELDITESEKVKPTAEVQSLLDILFKPNSKGNFVFVDMKGDLEEAYLHGANLQKATLKKARLKKAHLQKANMVEAVLQRANLQGADMQEVNLQSANLQKAFLPNADMQWANLQGADMQGAILQNADMQWADMQEVNLQWAFLHKAKLQSANLQGAFLQGAFLDGAFLQGANLQGAEINKETTMPSDWENVVKKDENGKTGVIFVED